jgi:hypothetical protein
MTEVVGCFGGGTNSAAMIIELVNTGHPLSLNLFADTGGEKPHTYEFIYHFTNWLLKRNAPPITWVKPAYNKTLERDCLDRHALPAIAYGFKTCSQRFKLQPQDKYLNNWQPAKDAWKRGEKVIKLIGYDASEERRAKEYTSKKYDLRYPLIEWGWDREKCIEVIRAAGLPLPGKSACFFCPSSKKQEILQLKKQYPQLLDRAVAMEKNANLKDIAGLGRDFAWGDLIAFDEAQYDLWKDDDWSTAEVPCGCYDG